MGQCGTTVPPENTTSSKYTEIKETKYLKHDAHALVLKEGVLLFISCKDIIKKDLTSKSDPFVVVHIKSSQTNQFTEIGRTEVIYDNHDPTFSKQFELDYYFEEQQILRFDVYDEDTKGSNKLSDHDCLGSCTMKLGEIVHETGMTMAKKLMHRGRSLKNKETKRYSHLVAMVERVPGKTDDTDIKMESGTSFLAYMQEGVDMSLMVAIDFTASNGNPYDHASLHYVHGDTPSKYQSAIRQIGNILSSYDTDSKYPVWGFGANFNNVLVDGKEYWNGTKHDFNLNCRVDDPEVSGIYGIEESYLSGLKNNVFMLSGPTVFQPILLKAKQIASVAHNKMMQNKTDNRIQYFILLIIADGTIHDMRQTKDIIVDIANQYLPLSIIIVGVGNADFGMMNELDGDEHGLINSAGEYGKRDVVQFVAMNKFSNLSDLSKETLFEIPSQFVSYVEKHDIKPRNKIAPNIEFIGNKFVLNDEKVDDVMDVLPSAPTEETLSCAWDNAPLPPEWERAYDENGRVYYVDNVNRVTSWTHPSS